MSKRKSHSPSLSAAQFDALKRMVSAYYEALRPDAKRVQPTVRYDRTVTQQEFAGLERLKAYAMGNLAYHNDSVGAVVETCVRLAVGTRGGTPCFLGDAAEWNQVVWDDWARHCGFAQGEHWNDMLRRILRTTKIHGDCLILVDHDLTDGKLRVWDADQICPLNASDFHRWGDLMGVPTEGGEDDPIWRQCEGAVLDPDGRVDGYFVTMKRNRAAVRLEDATYLPAKLCRRVGQDALISQFRSEPLLIPNMDLTNDTRQLLKAEVASARNHAELSFLLEEPETSDDVAALLTAVSDESGQLAPEVAEAAGAASGDLAGQLSQLLASAKEDLTAIEGKSAIGRIRPGSKVHDIGNANRPSQPIQQWIDKMSDLNGQRLGVLSCLARGRADNSYSSGQIELQISWRTFEEDQKMLERQVVDYVAGIVVPDAKYTVQWPSSFEIDPEKAEKTSDAKLRGGRVSFQEMLGPFWRRKLDAMKQVLDYCDEIGLDPKRLSWIGETSVGNSTPDTPLTPIPEENGNQN